MLPEIPADAVERTFLEFWRSRLLDPNDPQNHRWLEMEMKQVARAGSVYVPEIAAVSSLSGATVLDVGCQTGALPIAMQSRGATVTGIDVDNTLLDAARLRAKCHGVTPTFVTAKAESLPFENASFDVVTFIDVIEHVEDITKSLHEIVRVLRPGGVLFLQGVNRLSPHWLWRDPHYQMFGVSVMPPWMGRFYVTKVRRRPRYDVGVFPVGSSVVRTLERAGMFVDSGPRPPRATPIGRWRAAWEWRFASLFTLVARKKSLTQV